MTNANLSWLSTPRHAYLVVKGDTDIARRCATGFDYVDGDVVYLEEDCSAVAYLEHGQCASSQWKNFPGVFGDLPANATRLPAGDLGQRFLGANL